MTTLILGCGYLGRRVGHLLSQRGETVYGSVRSPQRASELSAWGIEPVIANVLDPGSLVALPPADRVLYCVGFDRRAGIPMRTVYVEGLRNVLANVPPGLNRLVYAGSTGVYGQDDGGWVDEQSPTEPIHESGRVCLEAEDLLREVASRRDLSAVVVRFSGLYGPDRIIRRTSIERSEPIPGDPRKWLNLIHIDDAAQAAVAALDQTAPGPIYLASDDRPLPRQEYYALVARALGAPEPRFEPPSPGSPEANREGGNKRISNRRLKEELGVSLRYPDVQTGLTATLARSADRSVSPHEDQRGDGGAKPSGRRRRNLSDILSSATGPPRVADTGRAFFFGGRSRENRRNLLFTKGKR